LPAGSPQAIESCPDATGGGVSDRAGMTTRKQSEPERLEQVAEAGESEKTPWILLGGVWVLCAAVVGVILAVTAIIAYLASRG
jgi:hypothetical protein